MGILRLSNVDLEGFLIVAKSITVGIAFHRTDHPRTLDCIECGLCITIASPSIAPCVDCTTIDASNNIVYLEIITPILVSDCGFNRRAEKRVEAMEDFVVVIHSVVVGIPATRIG